jgi:hypothetical protein
MNICNFLKFRKIRKKNNVNKAEFILNKILIQCNNKEEWMRAAKAKI